MKYKDFSLFGRKFTINKMDLGKEETHLIGNLYTVSCPSLGDDLITVYKENKQWSAVKPCGKTYKHISIYDACKKALIGIV